jgi:cytochrome c-type biogenesis protein CcmH
MTLKRPLSALALAAVLAVGAAASLTPPPAQAFTLEEFQFESPDQERSFRNLIAKLRCLVCQNESLAGSQADLAQDLREEVYGMMQEGKGDQEIIDFLVARYGDFVLYDPPIKPSTYILWFGPFVLVGIGAFLLVRALRRRKAEPDADLSTNERARLDQLLAQQGAAPSAPKDTAQ